MNSEPSVPNCPQCGAAIPVDAPQGLCPRCVLLGAATTTDAGKPVPRTEPPSPEALRAAFPHLEIVELIGRGGMGFVYKARQAKLDRLVALKLLPLELGADPHFAERFHREARALARLNHPGIVAVYDFGVSAGFGYLLMEFVDGVNLRQAMQAGRFTQREALTLVPKICEAIQFAHEQGVLHRDIKPENILLDTQGRVKIADFGIAKLVGEDAPDLTLTLSGARLGTPTYMAPEQIEHPGTVDHRADIYSLGVVFYELLTGELPLGRFAPPSAKADLDARVDDIVMRALAKERELRQQSAGEVKTQVETVAQAPAPGASLETASPRAIPTRTAAPCRFTALKVVGWAVAWLLIVFLTPSLIPVLGRTVRLPGGPHWVGLLWYLSLGGLAGLWMLVGCWIFRAEQKQDGSESFWPGWSRRVAGLFLAFTVLSAGRSLAMLWADVGREVVAVLVVPGEVGILATSLAILLRRHDLRLVATSGLFVHGLLTVAGFAGWLLSILSGGSVLPLPPEAAAGLSSGWLLAVAGLLVSLGLVTLWQDKLAKVDIRAALRHRLKLIGLTAVMLAVLVAGFLTLRRSRSQERFDQWLGIESGAQEVVSHLELQLPRGQTTALRATVWNNGMPTPLPAAGMSLLPGLLSEPTVLHWRLRRLNSPGDWELVVTGAKDEKLLGPVRVNLGTNVTALQPPVDTRLSPTAGTFNRWWPFLPSFVKGNGVTSPDLTFGWGLSVDVGPQGSEPTALAPKTGSPLDSQIFARLELQLAPHQRGRLTVLRWNNGEPYQTVPEISLTNLAAGAEATRIPLRWGLFKLPSNEHENADNISQAELIGPSADGTSRGSATGGRYRWARTGQTNENLQAAAPTAVIQGAQAARRWLFWSAEDAELFARTGQLPERIKSGFSAEYEPQAVPAGSDARVALELSVLLREKAADVRRRFEAGTATALEVAAAERDYWVAFALARGDRLNAAQANRTYAQLVLEDGRKRFEAGKLTSLELRGMEATNQIAELQLEELRQAITNRNQGPVVQIASLRLELAKRALEELKRRVEVGAVAATGPELSVAVQDVEAAETALKQVRIAASKAQLAELEKQYSDTNALHRAGKVRSTEFELTKLRFQRAQKEHQALVRQHDDSPAGLEWRKAWDRFQLVDEQAKAGRTSPLQWAFANMELDVAEARHGNDPLKEAYAVESYRREVLRVYREELGKGQRGRAEVDSAESMLKDAEIARQTIEQSRKLATPSP